MRIQGLADFWFLRPPSNGRDHEEALRLGPLRRRPGLPQAETASIQYRIRHNRIDKTGTVTLRYRSRLRHIRVGATHSDKPVLIFVAGADARVVTEEGELLRGLTIDPTSDYQPLNRRWPVHNVLGQASSIF